MKLSQMISFKKMMTKKNKRIIVILLNNLNTVLNKWIKTQFSF